MNRICAMNGFIQVWASDRHTLVCDSLFRKCEIETWNVTWPVSKVKAATITCNTFFIINVPCSREGIKIQSNLYSVKYWQNFHELTTSPPPLFHPTYSPHWAQWGTRSNFSCLWSSSAPVFLNSPLPPRPPFRRVLLLVSCFCQLPIPLFNCLQCTCMLTHVTLLFRPNPRPTANTSQEAKCEKLLLITDRCVQRAMLVGQQAAKIPNTAEELVEGHCKWVAASLSPLCSFDVLLFWSFAKATIAFAGE